MKYSFFLIPICYMVCFYAQSQAKKVVLTTGHTLTYFAVKPEIRSIGTTLLFFNNGNAIAENDFEKQTTFFTDKGISVSYIDNEKAISKAIAYLKQNNSVLRIDPKKIGVINYFSNSMIDDKIEHVGFLASVYPQNISLKKVANSLNIPMVIIANGDDTKYENQILKTYQKITKDGTKVDLHLEHLSNNEKLESWKQILFQFIKDHYGINPLYKEKSEAQKQAENWKNFQKMIEDRMKNDWAWINRFKRDNEILRHQELPQNSIVFIGNSITEGWINTDPDYFKEHPYINRGIGGQTTSQMLVRFREDVLNLKPKAVVILAGANDIAQNTGPITIENIFGNIVSMTQLAKANGIQPVLCSILPAKSFFWHPEIQPIEKIIALNKLLKAYAQKEHFIYVNYYTHMLNDEKGMKQELTKDGVHPNLEGYKVMEPILETALKALNKTN
ncbi:SGNH/GDSL hydrolase family protein [Zhouia sp. PK063]|uniref:SGNH/GDSL hydrolase family protein n=1 Tax=Zhouia sp. PK063 TaxID=3373602 RepID=UPI0037B44383